MARPAVATTASPVKATLLPGRNCQNEGDEKHRTARQQIAACAHHGSGNIISERCKAGIASESFTDRERPDQAEADRGDCRTKHATGDGMQRRGHRNHRKDHPLVEYIGEIGDREKSDFLSGAIGLLVPIDWPEPFGLVMIEAMACGTPVIAYNRGSVPEIIDEGLTGFIVEDETSAVSAVGRLSQLNRGAIRQQFETRFTARRMALDYLAAYRSLTEAAAPRIKLVSSAE